MMKWQVMFGLLVWLALPVQAAVGPLGEVASVSSKPANMFAKWRDMLARQTSSLDQDRSCKRVDGHVCIPSKMLPQVRFKKGKTEVEKLLAVNSAVNGYRYRSDRSAWGQADYWAAPVEFFAKGKGDCEDFAIAKFYVLRALGFAVGDMRLVVVKDVKARDFHAVLAVSVEGVDYVLDNRTSRLLVADRLDYLKPIYALNTEHWWLYEGAAKWVRG